MILQEICLLFAIAMNQTGVHSTRKKERELAKAVTKIPVNSLSCCGNSRDNRSITHSVLLSVGWMVGWLVGWLVSLSVGRLVGRSVCQNCVRKCQNLFGDAQCHRYCGVALVPLRALLRSCLMLCTTSIFIVIGVCQ